MSEERYLYFMQSGETVSIKDFFQNKRKMIAGRNKACDLHLLQYFDKGKIMRLSGQHFTIYQKDSRLLIKDLHSTNGTELDYEKLSPKRAVELRVGNIIRLAKEDDFLIRVIDDQTIDGTATMIENPQSQTTPPIQEVDSPSVSQPSSEKKKESGLYFDEALEAFIVDGEAIHLSPTLDDLLKYLYNNAERSCSFYELRQNVWHGMVKIDAIRAAVYSLRKKLDKASPGAGGERYIHNLHGYGYKLTLK